MNARIVRFIVTGMMLGSMTAMAEQSAKLQVAGTGAEKWLAIGAEGNYGGNWEEAAEYFRNAVLLPLREPAMPSAATRPAPALQSDWREEFAYTLGMQAFIYGWPWVNMARHRWSNVTQPTDTNNMPYAALNRFWHARHVVDATFREGNSPQSDTLYSLSWLDLTSEPVILSVPAVTGRYYSFELASMDSDNFETISTRTFPSMAGNYAIIGPTWMGSLPTGVTELAHSLTPYAFVVARTLVYDTNDEPNVHAIQDQYILTPLSCWGTTNTLPEDRNVWAPFPTNDPLADWKTMNRAMTENPPVTTDQLSFVNSLAQIGVGPNQDVDAMDAATKRGLIQAEQDTMRLMYDFNVAGGHGTFVNGWSYPPPWLGRAGRANDFITRAAAQCNVGLVASDTAEGTYMNVTMDSRGLPLTGDGSYMMRFAPGGLPEVNAFWSVTMYDMDHNYVSNSLNRYRFGTYPAGALKFDPDGSLPIYVQCQSPGADKETNWLPAPAGAFYMILRTYLPGTNILNQTWQPPAVAPVLCATASGACADYDGDGIADPSTYDENTGTWAVKLSGSGYATIPMNSFLGEPGYTAAAADYDGDRLGDPAVYRGTTGNWNIKLSSGGYIRVDSSWLLGGPGWAPCPADYDGDHKADPAIYQEVTGSWQMKLSASGYSLTLLSAFLGGDGSSAVSADFDGDGLADPAVYNRADGGWKVLLSASGYALLKLPSSLGGIGWEAVPADFDGDGLTDPAVRKSDGAIWQIMLSGSGYAVVSVPLGL